MDAINLNRRAFLTLAGASGVLALAPSLTRGARASEVPADAVPWSDPATWGGAVPGPATAVSITRTILLDVNTAVAGVTIAPGGTLVFDPGASRTLVSTGNIVVDGGTLQMHPGSADVIHRIAFTGVNESRFVGGGETVLSTDVGLWVTENGSLDLAGTPKLAWTRASGALSRGSTALTLDADPVGWSVGDEIAITPTLPPTVSGHSRAYDVASVAAISGRTITLSGPASFDHPAVSVGRGRVLGAEVLNLTRNVRVEGTPTGRAHVWIMATIPQSVSYAQMRFVGPRRSDGFVLGRYGLHFHMAMSGVSGSYVEGVVVRDAGNHAFVAHASEGVTFRDCISHNTFEDAYWWDLPDQSYDITYDRCVASLVQSQSGTEGFYTLTGFGHNGGVNNTARDCVAVGVQSNTNASGFNWPSQANGSDGVWTHDGCVAHNNSANGIFVWQNTANVHAISNFVGYHNGAFGIKHGAYRNPYQYRDSILYGNRLGGIQVLALSKQNGPMSFTNMLIDQAAMSPYCVSTQYHDQPAQAPVVFEGCEFRGYRSSALGFISNRPNTEPEVFDVVNCTFSGNEFWLDSRIHRDSIIRVKDPVHGSIALRRADQPGTLVSRWDARVSPISF